MFVQVDMTPKLAMATNILGGVPTFIGQYTEVGLPEAMNSDLTRYLLHISIYKNTLGLSTKIYAQFQIVVMKSSTPSAQAKLNVHALPFPFNKHQTKVGSYHITG